MARYPGLVARYPVMLDLDGRRCLVVGGGTVASRKVRGLLGAGAAVTVRSPALNEDLAALAAAGQLTWSAGPFASLDAPEPWAFVVAATDDPGVNREVQRQAGAAGVWANVATDATGGPAALPASWQQDRVTVAVSTDGIHPGAARWLRDRAVAAIGPEPLVALALVEEVGGRPDWRQAVDSGMLEAIRAGHLAEAKERLEACLSSSSD